MQDDKLYRIIQSLRDMFIGLPQVPELFEMVVYHSVVSQHFNWQVYKNEIWVDHKWGLSKNRKLRKNNEMVTEMEKGVLYKPVDLQFPAVDFVYMENLQKDLTRKTVYCIQVTFSSSHQKTIETYKKLYNRLGMNPQVDEIFVYLITQPRHVAGYIEDLPRKLVCETSLPNLHFTAVKEKNDWKVVLKTMRN